MPVKVIYENDVLDEIEPSSLDQLIALNRIKKFLRSEGWATVGTDPIRGRRRRYEGPERRKKTFRSSYHKPGAEAVDTHYFGCATSILDALRDPFLVLDADLKVLSASKTYYDIFKVTPEETLGIFLYDLGNHQWDIPALRQLLEDILRKKNTTFDNFEVDNVYAGIGQKIILFNALRLHQEKIGTPMVLLAIEDITQRREMEHLLEAHETKYRDLVQNVNSVILKMGPEGKITFFNKFAQSFFGYTEEEIRGRSVIGTIAPETDSAGLDLASMIKDIGTNPEKYINNENENMRRNGERVWVVWTNKAMRDRNGNVVEILCIGNDITEHKRMENELRNYEERFRHLFETSKDGLLLIDKQSGNIVNANAAMAELMGYSTEEFLGKKLPDVGLFESMEDFQETTQKVNELGFIHYEDMPVKTRGGQSIDTEIYLVNRAHFLQCSVRNITEHKRVKEALAESMEKMTAIAESSIDAVIMINDEGVVLFFNHSAEEMFGYRHSEVTGRKLHDFLVSPEAKEEYYEALPSFQMTGQCKALGKAVELSALRKDGTRFPIELSMAAVQIRGKWHAAGTVRDTTERKQAEKEIGNLNEELKDKVIQLEAANREMEAFNYSVSHDLRAPVNIANNLSELVLNDYHDKLDDEGRKLLHLIIVNTKRMNELIEALLDLSRISRQGINIGVISMERTAALVAEELKATDPARNIAVNVKELPDTHGDLTLIRQVFINLLSNAFKFTRGKDTAAIEVGGWSEGSENIYYVKDNGAGFNMDYADKLFRVFQRLHSLREFDGIGIGLSIVHRIIQRHGGRVWAEGKVNEGATFYFTLPQKAV